MHIRQILARREEIRNELHSIQNAHPIGSALPDEVRTRLESLEGEATCLNDSERRQVLLNDLDLRAQGVPLNGGSGDTGFDAMAAKVTILDTIRAQMGATDAGANRAKDVSSELERRSGRRAQGLFFPMGARRAAPEQRVFSTLTPSGGPGGNLIETDVFPTVADRLRERIVVRQLGATVLSGLQGNLALPRLKTSATAFWVPDNGAITLSEPATDVAATLTPKHVGGIVEISRNMIMQPSIDVAAMVESDLAKIIANAIDVAAIQGGGTNQPSGLLASGSGITIVPGATNGVAIDWNAVVALIAAVDVANALTGNLAFLANGKLVSKLRRTLKTSVDTSSNFLMTEAGSLAGYPLASTQNTPSNLTKGTGTALSALIFGDWSELVIGFWSELDVLVNPFETTAYAKGSVQIRAMATCDVAIKQPLAFAAIVDAITT